MANHIISDELKTALLNFIGDGSVAKNMTWQEVRIHLLQPLQCLELIPIETPDEEPLHKVPPLKSAESNSE